MLEKSLQEIRGQSWSSWNHLGIMRYAAGDREGARRAWKASLDLLRTPWALRNLAVLLREDGDAARAGDLWLEACRMRPDVVPLALEAGQALIDAGRPREWLELLRILPEKVRGAGRIRLLEGWAALALQDFERVAGLLEGDLVVDDLREGERSLSHLWFEFHEGRIRSREGLPPEADLRARVRREHPVPERFDFRMATDPPLQEGDPGSARKG
jgi:tetratricopeptide (TPR) repeat protein